MARAFLYFFIAVFLFCQQGFSQKKVTHLQQVWGGYFNQTRFSNKLGFYAEVQLRAKEDFITDVSQLLLRTGLTYYVNDKLRISAGYGFINAYPADNHPGVSVPEHRPWQQFQWLTSSKRSRLMQWIRLEERYRRKVLNPNELADAYSFNWRVRYNLLLMLPLSKDAFQKNTVSFVTNDEIMVNAGKEIVYNTFDQNRFFVGFAYHVNSTDYLQAGYLNVYQQLAAGNQYKMIHVPRIYFFHNLDLRKKQ